ncbi:MAG: hypothetical protein HOP17_17230 [Acidobacteria bacterium]|nr:hypothetical protein [Acidobacteriota bacterium]
MSVFEDLIDELKNENLLEDTVVVNTNRADAAARPDEAVVLQRELPESSVEPKIESSVKPTMPMEVLDAVSPEPLDLDLPQIERPANEREFYRKRAMDEVSSLQMVEHVLSGVEREHMKTVPVPFDDLNAKKALHRFMQVSGDLKSPEHAEAEFILRQETEAWSYALFERDQKISVANIRRFCEESRPVLSSQALIALARFYRNSPYSEDIRGKFDYVMTRLFSRETEEGLRRLLFQYADMIGHINTLYANWSSIALYTHEDDQIEVSLTITRFDEFRIEIENAESFDELLESDFFSRVRSYKEESAEMFYVPEVVARAIRCNLAIGNRFIDLMGKERARSTTEKISEKYEDVDQLVSNVAGKTLVLSEVLAMEIGEAGADEGDIQADAPPTAAKAAPPRVRRKTDDDSRFDFFGINKWLMIVGAICLLLSAGVYMWGEKIAAGDGSNLVTAKPMAIDDPDIKMYVRSPRTSEETLYAVAEPAFDSLDDDKKKELLAKMQKLAASKNLKKVSLLNSKGRTVGFASQNRLEIISQ